MYERESREIVRGRGRERGRRGWRERVRLIVRGRGKIGRREGREI